MRRLFIACEYGNLEGVKELLENGSCTVTSTDENGWTPLHFAAKHVHLSIVQFLTDEKGADANMKNVYGWTPLHLAAFYGRLEIIKHLVEHCGPNIQATTDRALTPIDLASGKFVVQYFQDPTPFQLWLRTENNGEETTLEQQIMLAARLYDEANGIDSIAHGTAAVNPQLVIQFLSEMPLQIERLVSWKGINVGWFVNHFCQSPYMKKLKEFGCELWFVRKVCVIEMMRRSTGQLAAGPFILHVAEVFKNMRRRHQHLAKEATTFFSYTGAYTLDFFIQGLQQLDPKDYMWIDIFCVDQFAWTAKKKDPEMQQFIAGFTADLQKQIQRINNTALLLEKWDDAMQALEQIWVLWEIFNTANANTQFQILLSQSERKHFIYNCLNTSTDRENIQAPIASIDVTKAKAEDDQDKSILFSQMKQVAGGLERVNTMIRQTIGAWLVQEGITHFLSIDPIDNSNEILHNVKINLGVLFEFQGKHEKAEQQYRECLALSELNLLFWRGHPVTLACMDNLALLLQSQGRLDEAEPLFRECLAQREQLQGSDHPDTVKSISNWCGLLT